MDGMLARIVERTRTDVEARKGRIVLRDLEERGMARRRSRRGLAAALERSQPEQPVRFITEIKKASPSRGVLDPNLEAGKLAAVYREHGAAALSVVTEPHFFQGTDAFLEDARAAAPDLPILRKDFHVHELQLLEAAAGEADAVLLLAAVLEGAQLRDYLQLADAFALGHLVEVADRKEAERALKAGARVIGVNNRDLVTFRVDPARTESVAPLLCEAGAISVAESGIADRATVERFERLGVDALLVGEALVTAPDPGARLHALRGLAADPETGPVP
jgi:indole-3-glycerol phosphate synthase